MPSSVDLYGTAYGNFAQRAIEHVRLSTYGEDFGQSSWITGDEYRRFLALLGVGADGHILDVGCGSGGPALFVAREAGCRVTGIDVNEAGINAGQSLIREAQMADRVALLKADVAQPLPFGDCEFDALVCIDAICHFPGRARLFGEWRRILRPGGRMLFTDPVVITGLVTKEELATRSSTGHFEFCPVGVNDRLIADAGFEVERVEDVTENAAGVSKRWHDARQSRSEELIRLEGAATFAGLQRFLAAVHRLSSERRLSRLLYLGRKPSGA
jgi:cyclopropane fatty-acyl-phospholipid synthase-like methyltransferase